MIREEILKKIESIIHSIKPGITIKTNTALIGEFILDSLEFMNYLVKIENAFNLKIPDSDVTKYKLGIIENMIFYISGNLDK